MTINTVATSQSPDAKPVAVSRTLTTNYMTIISAPNFEIPELVFGGSVIAAPGIAEVISPLIISNKTSGTVFVDIRVYRFNDYSTNPPTLIDSVFSLATNLPIPEFDSLAFPLNGQFFYNGDLLEVKASSNGSLDVTVSYTIGQAEEFLED